MLRALRFERQLLLLELCGQSMCIYANKKGIKPLPGGVSGHCERIAPAAQWACSSSSTCVAVSDAQGANRAEAEQLEKKQMSPIVVIGTSSGGEDTIEKT